MNFKKLPRDKRNLLIAVGVGTLLAVAGLYFFLIEHQNQNLVHLAEKKVAAEASRRQVLDAIKRASEIETNLADAKKALADAEADIASGDLYSWVITTLRQFKTAYKQANPRSEERR